MEHTLNRLEDLSSAAAGLGRQLRERVTRLRQKLYGLVEGLGGLLLGLDGRLGRGRGGATGAERELLAREEAERGGAHCWWWWRGRVDW